MRNDANPRKSEPASGKSRNKTRTRSIKEEQRSGEKSSPLCPLCQRPFEPLYAISRFDPPLEILRCPECGLQRQARIPENPSALYEESYYTGQEGYTYRDERRTLPFDRHVWRARLRRIASLLPPPSDFLDIGCAFGGFLKEARTMGYRTKGADISGYAVESARKEGLDVVQGVPGPDLLKGESFDVVTLVEVLEHLPHPREAFQSFRRLVRPGGLLLIQTANFEGLQAKREGSDYGYYLPGHFYYYSTKNLRRLLSSYGFENIRFYRGVDFGLLPKLRKSRGGFHGWRDYLRWFRIARYHFASKIAFGDFALTSSMVVYARRRKKGETTP